MTLNRTVLKKGDMVKIKLDKNSNTVTPGMLPYDGELARVSRVGGRCNVNGNDRQLRYIYELEGVISPYGIPYSFIREMLISSDEEEDTNGY